MTSLSQRGYADIGHEHAIGLLRDSTGAPLAEVRILFAQELARLELNATVRSFLPVLAVSNVRTMLRQRSAQSLSVTWGGHLDATV